MTSNIVQQKLSKDYICIINETNGVTLKNYLSEKIKKKGDGKI